jgi:hypothetical protein
VNDTLLYKRRSCVVSIKRILTLKLPSKFVFFVLENSVFKIVYPFKIHQHSKFDGPTLTGASSAPSSGVFTSATYKINTLHTGIHTHTHTNTHTHIYIYIYIYKQGVQ